MGRQDEAAQRYCIMKVDKIYNTIRNLKPCESIWVWAKSRNVDHVAMFKVVCNGSKQLYFCDLVNTYNSDAWFEFWKPIEVIKEPGTINDSPKY